MKNSVLGKIKVRYGIKVQLLHMNTGSQISIASVEDEHLNDICNDNRASSSKATVIRRSWGKGRKCCEDGPSASKCIPSWTATKR
ncbi:hypothetical protein CHS0354_006440 [Potamilus streckersoni]|uniref:Uncharacterized protein n=1 Tax=Potamilus streckersoni TaxID=2493646 RepID=A0AAE0TA32_9BIVA|nr:hypothetical protein CHS0354_006440 [Potamilus streckersoni]